MRKTLVGIAGLLMALSTTGRAQNVDFGVTTGFQFASQYNKYIPNFSGRLGLLLGGHASIFINNRIVIKPILMFSRKGSWIESDARPEEDLQIYAITNDYLSLPVLAKLYLTKGLHVQAGPQISYLLASATKVGGSKTSDGNLKKQGIIRPFDAGVVFGLGYEFPSTFSVSLNVDVSFVNQIEEPAELGNVLRQEFEPIDFRGLEFPSATHNLALQFIFSYNFTKNRSAF